ncbi:hypothetical protein HRR83_001608 [Exophiala dermatitidis]|uniref:Uncharacterized protein n=1 Tax=Exophiala dermatitidis TaxID=5970 RepID=A0AAN6IY17_EXODE|nr:hypothetical protein HRR73_004742 [Exophiala dermatitidis]KAJ4526415.1 hypothetical protein HRR74_001612 [Exophiala dermatitidis]KAJ4532341.1 hypothetical protein HRR76_007339 [Exophiala dermatitidis]KAJ4546379.1 hypothetical protein HRR77_004913 [Exophiala dermatitidis]KAJ4567378.1 hypothetical protein HRR79_004896 [Exophiala dermatitidis]
MLLKSVDLQNSARSLIFLELCRQSRCTKYPANCALPGIAREQNCGDEKIRGSRAARSTDESALSRTQDIPSLMLPWSGPWPLLRGSSSDGIAYVTVTPCW